MARFQLTKQEKSWIMYDVGNSAMVMLAAALIPIYFSDMVAAAGLSPDNSTAMVLWSYGVSIATLVVALLMPVLGSLADFKGYKKKFFLGFVGTGCVFTLILGFSTNWLLFLIVYAIAMISLNLSLVFYDGFLTDATTDERMDNVSASGYAWGYIGSCIPFIICIAIYALQLLGYLPISASAVRIITCAITAVWWFVFCIPLLRNVEQNYCKKREEHAVAKAFKGLGPTLRDIARNKAILYYLIAYFFYIDGVYTIINEATIFGSSVGVDSISLVLALLVTQFIAFPSAIIYGRLCGRFGTRRMIIVGVVAYMLLTCYASFFLYSATEFWVLAVTVGMFQGGIQSCSRSYFGKLIPKEQANEYFGFFDLFGKYAAVVGALIVGIFTQFTGNMHLGVLSLAILFIIGLVFLILMPKTEVERVDKLEEAVEVFMEEDAEYDQDAAAEVEAN